MSATPGKTKHYQTHVDGSGDIVLVDGPGLVIPDLRMTKPSMVLAGILPIDTLTDPLPCIDLMLQKVPFAYIQVRKDSSLWHRGCILTSHPAVLGSILGILEN